MAIRSPQSVITALGRSLGMFRHARMQQEQNTSQLERVASSQKPLEEIPGTNASFEAVKQSGPQGGERKG